MVLKLELHKFTKGKGTTEAIFIEHKCRILEPKENSI